MARVRDFNPETLTPFSTSRLAVAWQDPRAKAIREAEGSPRVQIDEKIVSLQKDKDGAIALLPQSRTAPPRSSAASSRARSWARTTSSRAAASDFCTAAKDRSLARSNRTPTQQAAAIPAAQPITPRSPSNAPANANSRLFVANIFVPLPATFGIAGLVAAIGSPVLVRLGVASETAFLGLALVSFILLQLVTTWFSIWTPLVSRLMRARLRARP